MNTTNQNKKKQSEITIGATGTEYGNWMSAPVMKMAFIIDGVLAVVLALIFILWGNVIAEAIVAILLCVMLGFTMFLQKVRNAVSFSKGKLMDKIQQNLMEHLAWDGQGKALDVGCGSAALSARLLKTYESAELEGVSAKVSVEHKNAVVSFECEISDEELTKVIEKEDLK